MILIIFIVFILVYLLLRFYIDSIYFKLFYLVAHRKKCKYELEKYTEDYLFTPQVLIKNIFINKGTNKDNKNVLIFIHGILITELSIRNKITSIRKVYDGDIIYTMIDSIGCDGTKITNISDSIKIVYDCINYVKNLNKYNHINAYGHSMGGYLLIKTMIDYNINYINNVYLQSTFSSLRECEFPFLTELLIFLLKDDELNLNRLLYDIKCNKLIILHSKDDNLIDFNHAIRNSKVKNPNINKIKLIEITGKHIGKFHKNFKLLD